MNRLARLSDNQLETRISKIQEKIMDTLSADMDDKMRKKAERRVKSMEVNFVALQKEYQFRTAERRLSRMNTKKLAASHKKLETRELPQFIKKGKVIDVITGYRRLFVIQDKQATTLDAEFKVTKDLKIERKHIMRTAVAAALSAQ